MLIQDGELFGRFPVEKYVPISSERSYSFCDRVAPQTGFPNFMEEVGVCRRPRGITSIREIRKPISCKN
jgi:hypothetical protein